MEDTLRMVSGVFFLLVAVFGSLYVGLWVCAIGGIIGIITEAGADPVDTLNIIINVIRFFSAGIVGWIIFFFGIFCAKLSFGE